MRSRHLHRIICFVLIPFSLASYAQENLSFHADQASDYEKYRQQNNFHTFIKPYLNTDLNVLEDTTQPITQRNITDVLNYKWPDTLQKISLSLYPLLHLQPSFDLGTGKVNFDFYGGAGTKAAVGKKIALSLNHMMGYTRPLTYINDVVRNTGIVPGLGLADSTARGYTFQNSSGYISYSPNTIFNFQLGKDKHFWGDGYRSLFLSDVSNNYPYLKVSTSIWKLKYVNLFTAFKDVTAPSGLRSDFKNKYGTFHHLSWNATKWLNVGIFESIIWSGTDTNRVRGYDINYLNPILFFRPVEYSLGSSDNALLGFNFKIKALKKYEVYGQVILDEFLLSHIKARNGWWANKQGIQLGLKAFDLFTDGLSFQSELNLVRPYTYSHGVVQQNYGHFNQPLAHPFGGNFIESISFLRYHYGKYSFEIKALQAVYGKDTSGISYGKNIFLSYMLRPGDFGHQIGQGLKTTLTFVDTRISYNLVPAFRLRAELGIGRRMENNASLKHKTMFVYLGIRSSFYNLYNDY